MQVSGLGHVDGPVGRGDDRRAEPVGGRSRAHGIDLDLGLEQLSEAGLESLGDGVGAVRRGVACVRGDERLQDLGGGAGYVVAVEVLLHAHRGLLGSTGRGFADQRPGRRNGSTIGEDAPRGKGRGRPARGHATSCLPGV